MTMKMEENYSVSDSSFFLKAIFDASPDMIFIFGDEGTLLDANDSAIKHFQFSKEELLNQPPGLFLSRNECQSIAIEHIKRAAHRTSKTELEWLACRKDGTEFPVEVRIQPLPRGLTLSGQPARVLTTIRDISERKAYEEKILRMAHYDKVTGLINRTLFEDRAQRAIKRAQRNERKLAMLFFDLDKFKQINDTFGHLTGDRLLKAVGRRVGAKLRSNDTLGRIAGDEFVIIAEEINCTDDAMVIAEKILDAMMEPFGIDNECIQATASVGISLFPEHGQDLNTLMYHSDKAMYRAKSLGRNMYAVFNPNLPTTAVPKRSTDLPR